MAAAPPQQSSSSDNSYAPLWIMVLIVLIALGLWFFAREFIVRGVFYIKIFEAKAFTWFTDQLDPVVNFMQNSLYYPQAVTPEQLWAATNLVGEYIRWPVIAFLLLCGVFLFKSDVKSRFKKRHSMITLMKQEYVNWPQIAPVVNLSLQSTPLDEGGWAMALAPLPFSKKFHILRYEKKAQDPNSKRFSSAAEDIRFAINRGEAKRIFTMQLGDYWQGLSSLNIHTKALFAMFAAKMNRDREGYTKLMKQINRSTVKGNLDFSGVDELLAKHSGTKVVQRIMGNHAYVLTIMATMVTVAREDGVLATSDFLWLKPLDRRMWYMLNCTGRQTVFCEVAGPFAHWLAERRLGRKSLVPMVNEAVNALENAVLDIKYVPERDNPNPEEQ